ncbi:Uncharacterised protein [Chryseobacterium taihuense]|uniref:Uncharacterized protein n=2 Tax=Chryseobacterium group TaxID=2782232 RepID=A0A4U8W9P8_9FLAO|nr:Uncharacterised protein [Chryseobacterium taihuense]
MLEKQILTHINGIIIYRNFVENLPYNPLLIPLAKEKRKLGILSERRGNCAKTAPYF